jgi:hypothetical protein
MPKREVDTPEQKQIQCEIITDVIDTAMHILHESYLNGSDLWPTGGMLVGGPGWYKKGPPDAIYLGVNPYGYEQEPIKGRFSCNMFNTPEKRMEITAEHLRIIFDQAISNNIYFENEFKSSYQPATHIWFTFTYLPTTK